MEGTEWQSPSLQHLRNGPSGLYRASCAQASPPLGSKALSSKGRKGQQSASLRAPLRRFHIIYYLLNGPQTLSKYPAR